MAREMQSRGGGVKHHSGNIYTPRAGSALCTVVNLDKIE